MIIIRDYDHPDRRSYAISIVRIAKKHGHIVLLAGDMRLALAIGADGLHVSEKNLSTWKLKRNNDIRGIVTTSVHTMSALLKIQQLPISAIFISPVFETTSHPGKPAMGYMSFMRNIKYSKIPVYALGGISAKNISYLKHSKAKGVGAIDAFSVL